MGLRSTVPGSLGSPWDICDPPFRPPGSFSFSTELACSVTAWSLEERNANINKCGAPSVPHTTVKWSSPIRGPPGSWILRAWALGCEVPGVVGPGSWVLRPWALGPGSAIRGSLGSWALGSWGLGSCVLGPSGVWGIVSGVFGTGWMRCWNDTLYYTKRVGTRISDTTVQWRP